MEAAIIELIADELDQFKDELLELEKPDIFDSAEEIMFKTQLYLNIDTLLSEGVIQGCTPGNMEEIIGYLKEELEDTTSDDGFLERQFKSYKEFLAWEPAIAGNFLEFFLSEILRNEYEAE